MLAVGVIYAVVCDTRRAADRVPRLLLSLVARLVARVHGGGARGGE
jgi:hypothetical protein